MNSHLHQTGLITSVELRTKSSGHISAYKILYDYCRWGFVASAGCLTTMLITIMLSLAGQPYKTLFEMSMFLGCIGMVLLLIGGLVPLFASNQVVIAFLGKLMSLQKECDETKLDFSCWPELKIDIELALTRRAAKVLLSQRVPKPDQSKVNAEIGHFKSLLREACNFKGLTDHGMCEDDYYGFANEILTRAIFKH